MKRCKPIILTMLFLLLGAGGVAPSFSKNGARNSEAGPWGAKTALAEDDGYYDDYGDEYYGDTTTEDYGYDYYDDYGDEYYGDTTTEEYSPYDYNYYDDYGNSNYDYGDYLDSGNQEDAGYFGVVDGNGNEVQVDENGAFFYADEAGNRQYYDDLQKESFQDAQTGAKYDLSAGNVELYADQNGQSGAARIDSTTGQVSSFTTGGQTYKVGYNSSGQPYYTNGAGQQVLVGSAGGAGGVGSWLGNLLGVSGGIGYSQGTGVYGNLGFGTSAGYGASSGNGYLPGIATSGSYGTGTGYGGMTGVSGMGAGASGWNPANYISTGLPAGSIYNIIESIVMWILAIFGFISIIGFVISGILYLTAAGDEKAQEKAKRAMYYSIIGVIVGLVGLVVIFAVNALLRGASFF